MIFWDAHCHLQLKKLMVHEPGWIERAVASGVRGAICNATSEDDFGEVGELARGYKWIHPAFGLHPWWVGGIRDGWEVRLREVLINEITASIGEVGLDFVVEDASWEGVGREIQIEVFLVQWRLSVELRRPISIHCRKAFGCLAELLEKEGPHPVGFLLHGYGGPAEMVPRFAALGGHFSFGGALTNPSHKRVRTALQAVPLDRLHFESDAPDMPMLGADGVRLVVSQPADLPFICRVAADLRGTSAEELAAAAAHNSAALFTVHWR